MVAVLLLAALGPLSPARGQSDDAKPTAAQSMPLADDDVKPIPTVPGSEGVVPAGCSTCGGGGLLNLGSGGGDCLGCGCGNGGQCSPGRRPCDCCCDESTCVGRFINGLYHCICCPDPCYDPSWLAVADAAFFVDAVRPITQMRFRWDQSWDMNFPDRAEFFWARENTKAFGGPGKGPSAAPPQLQRPVRTLDVDEFKIYTEAAAGRAGIAIEMPYRHIERDFDASGFADMTIATKAMLLDCQLIQITFQFKTYIPSGNFLKGLGTAHVSLEPGLLWGLRITPSTYLQAQTSLWIPIGGDGDYEANVFHYHLSLNQILYKPCEDLQVIGTLEFNGWTFLSGLQSDPVFGTIDGRGTSASGGPGIRVVICDKLDFGVGSAFAFTNHHWADEMMRWDFRWRF
jgi:hypothetical protein